MLRPLILPALLWTAVWPLAAGAAEPPETEYAALMLNDQKVGHMIEERRVDGDRVVSTVTTAMTLTRGGATVKVTQVQQCTETTEGKPIGFETTSRMGMMEQTVRGTLREDGTMKIVQQVGQQKMEREMPYPEGALMLEGASLAEKRHGHEPGTEYELTLFLPEMLTVAKAKVTVGEKEELDLLGRVTEGIKVLTELRIGGTVLQPVTYVTPDGETLRMDMSMAGMKVSAIWCDKAFALSPATSTTDFLLDTLVTCPAALPAEARQATFHLKPKPDKKVSIPETDTQKVATGEDGVLVVTVERADPPSGHGFPCEDPEGALKKALEPAGFVQSEDEEIVAAAREAVGETRDAAEAARRIADWVHTHIQRKTLSIGYASASEVMRTRQGDCTEHAVLTAAMCRAVGIPARIASGLQYVEGLFGKDQVLAGHEWAQIRVGEKWYDLDATRPPAFRDARRITLAVSHGEMQQMLGILNNLGRFEVTAARAGE